jgi:ADP-heptose:LPS heptosyltransferase
MDAYPKVEDQQWGRQGRMTTDRMIEEATCALTWLRKSRDANGLNPETASSLAMRAAELIIECYKLSGQCLRESVALLCEITSHKNERVAQAGTSALFPALVEQLADSFDPAACPLYDQIFAQVINFYRRSPGGEKLDEELGRFGLVKEADLLARKSRITNRKSQIAPPNPNPKRKKVLLLSRVTIGADVAVTSVIIAKLHDLFPEAEFVILGSRKLRDLFGGNPRIRIHEIAYSRGATVLSRLVSWLDVVGAVNDELRGLKSDDYLIIDPDSRLTQLGLLPLVKNDIHYYFFESRSFRRKGASQIGQLASQWMNEVFAYNGEAFPFVALPHKHRQFGRRIANNLKRSGSSHLIVISLGVGGNERKRISNEFERTLVERLSSRSTLILDKGATNDEHERVNRLISSLRQQDKTILEINEENISEVAGQDSVSADVVTWDGGIGALAGLIAASDQYIGYDSAGQHIAAALKVPALIYFVNSNSAVFAERWRAFGPGSIRVINLNADELSIKSGRDIPIIF